MTRRRDEISLPVKVHALVCPRQAKPGQQRLQRAPWVADEAVIVEHPYASWPALQSVLGQPLHLSLIVRDIAQIAGIGGLPWIQMLLEDRETSV
mgnify:CR=1 FL=1